MMNGYTWTSEDVRLVEKFIEIRNRGFYCDGGQLTEVYNRVLNKRAASTSCGSCLRQRVTELEGALNHFKRQMELSGMTSTEELVNEVNAIKEEIKPKVTKARKK